MTSDRGIGMRFAAMVATAWLGVLAGQLAWAQDDWDAGEEAPDAPVARQGMDLLMPEQNFNRWVFGGTTATEVEKRLDSLLALQVESVDRASSLSDAQKRKLRLAGRGDVRRFFRSVEELRARSLQVEGDQQKFNQVIQDIQPLQAKLQSGLFGEGSLFRKVLKRTLDPEQAVRYERQERLRRRFRYEAKIELVVAMLEAGVPLRDEQRQKLVKLLVDQTEPPKKFGQHDYYVVLYQAGQLEEEKLKPIFDEAQWRALSRVLAQAEGMEAFLKRNGFLP